MSHTEVMQRQIAYKHSNSARETFSPKAALLHQSLQAKKARFLVQTTHKAVRGAIGI
jgi:hypothetical protein